MPLGRAVGPLLLYVAISFLFFGVPVVGHPGREIVGNGRDPEIFVWMFAWWPHALLHGLDPFRTNELFTPETYNLAWTTSVPALAVLFAPLTLLFGPVAAYNVAAVLMPALAAWTAYLLCRHLTRSLWPSLVGGYLFGFSAYMLGQEQGHLHMTAVFLVPLVALLVLRYLDGTDSGRTLVLKLGIVLGLQLWCSTELFATVTAALVLGLALGFAVAPERRARLRRMLGPLAGAYGVAAVLASPLIFVTLRSFQSGSLNRPRDFPTDLLNPLIPTRLVLASGWGRSIAEHFTSGEAESGAYLGLPVLAIVVLFAVGRRRTAGGRFLIAAFALGLLLALGTTLHVDGHTLARLPMWALTKLPVVDNVLPSRLAVYVTLAAAVIVALWAARARQRWLAVVLCGLAVAGVVPALGKGYWNENPARPAFFSASAVKHCLVRGEIVLAIPYGPNGDSMLWQAESGFWFRLAGGYVTPGGPRTYTQDQSYHLLALPDRPTEGVGELLGFARGLGATVIAVEEKHENGWIAFLKPELPLVRVGGVAAFPLIPGPEGSPACRRAVRG